MKIALLTVGAFAGAFLLIQSASAENAKIEQAAKLYDTYCAQCHGVQRNGKGVNTIGLPVQPRDHSDTTAMSSLPREQMMRAIREGGASVNKSALMPPWSSVLTDEQIGLMADYLLYVCKCEKPN